MNHRVQRWVFRLDRCRQRSGAWAAIVCPLILFGGVVGVAVFDPVIWVGRAVLLHGVGECFLLFSCWCDVAILCGPCGWVERGVSIGGPRSGVRVNVSAGIAEVV